MKPLVVVGAGAAGLMAAWWAAHRGAPVVLLEASRDAGRKILISGGGRCNILPSVSSLDDFHSEGSRNVLRRLFRTWPLTDMTRWFEEELELPLVLEKESGKLFPEVQRAKVVRDKLVAAVEAQGAELRCGWRVETLEAAEGGGFLLRSSDGQGQEASRVVLASGGRSVPKTGSDGHGYELARRLGHRILPTYPALVPLTTNDAALRELSGLAVPVRWQAWEGQKVVASGERDFLFTHQGFSGPAVLDASHHHVHFGRKLTVAWAGMDEERWKNRFQAAPAKSIGRHLSEALPRRLAEELLRRAQVPADLRAGNLDKARRTRLLDLLCRFALPVDGTRGFAVAEVTGGGIPLDEVDPSTLESRKQPGLYLCGEILDVFGRIGGFNFQWAWLTGRLVASDA
ncbi:MAG: aminoacetone oxidase family FAD-binding enzyme [Planctomycetota bacterium]